ncbi:MAG: tetratricopeptide repeat protein [Candidatus Omnitrophica bacterium]|nr:tetratricopeptide repeat protein [Candidatus Omnitrophota bacterium]
MVSKFDRWKKGLALCLCACVFLTAKAFAWDRRLAFSLSHYIMAGVLEQMGESEASIREYKKALNIDYKNAAIHLGLALDYLKNNEIPKAVGELNLSIKFDREAVEPHAILALLYFSQNKADLATEEYEIALKNAAKLEPGNVDIYKSLGIVYLRQKKLKDAENTFRLILDLSPNDSEAHFYLANIYDETNNRPAAIEELKKTLQLKPDYPDALNYLGYIDVEENKNLDKAQVMIKKALELEPENGAYIDSLGWLYYKQGKFEEALKELKRAAALLDDPVILDHLGDVYFRLKDVENAKSNWQKSLKLDPGQQKVREKIEKCSTPINKSKD